MDPAGRQQAHHDEPGRCRGLGLGDEIGQGRIAGEGAAGDLGVDARQVLHHHPAAADVHVADFGIAHLTRRQTDGPGRGVEQGHRRLAHGPVVEGGCRLGYGVVFARFAVAPAVKNAKHDGARRLVFVHGDLYRAKRPLRTALCGRGSDAMKSS